MQLSQVYRVLVKTFLFFGLTGSTLCGFAQENEASLKAGLPVVKLSGIYSSKGGVVNPAASVQPGDAIHLIPEGCPGAGAHCTEAVDQRTLTSRTFIKDDGERVIEYNSRPIHYYDQDHLLQPIQTALRANSSGGWEASAQEFPCMLNADGSTAIIAGAAGSVSFNRNCRINNGEVIPGNFTVGENGLFAPDILPGINKKIVFSENSIETDYVITRTLNGTGDLVFSEDITVPNGCNIHKDLRGYPLSSETAHEKLPLKTQWAGDYVVYDEQGTEITRFKAPVFYDANHAVLHGSYVLKKDDNNERLTLQFTVPSSWLNDSRRAYPVTIDPLVTGPTSNYPAIYMNSCVVPSYASDSILITIPANITIINFNVTDSYFADVFAGAQMKYGSMYLTSPCGSTPDYTVASPRGDSAGYAYLDNADLKSYLACCFKPSCVTRTFYLANHLGRTNGGPGCNQNYIYYSPNSPWPFKAYIVGRTVETTQAQWSVAPTTLCSDSCHIKLHAYTNFGVPPYTITHPWTGASLVYGTAIGGCSSTGQANLILTIPGCPTVCGSVQTLNVPPPVIIDSCGNQVTGLSPKPITINPVPVITPASTILCSGNLLNLPEVSCVAGTTYSWTGSNGTNGTGNLQGVLLNPTNTADTVKYTVIPTANGCVGAPVVIPVAVNPSPTVEAGPNDSLKNGASITLNGSGATTYSWIPSRGLSCSTCASPVASPDQTTTYILEGTNTFGCTSSDTLVIIVTAGDETVYIPNCFTPSRTGENDIFYVYGFPLYAIDLRIYDRWGELIYETTDLHRGWDGRYKGKLVEAGVYVYSVDLTWISQKTDTKVGIVTVLR